MLALWLGFGFWWIHFDLVGRRLPRADGGAVSAWAMSHLPITLSITAAGAGMVSLIGHAHDPSTPAGTSWLLALRRQPLPAGQRLGRTLTGALLAGQEGLHC